MPASSWLIGTFSSDSTLDVETAASGGNVLVQSPAGPLYLHDSTGSRSYVTTLAAAILAACPSCVSVAFTLQANRRLRVNFGAATSIDWTGNTDIRDALGFTGNLAMATSHTAPNISPLLWVPGLTEISDMRLGRPGLPTYDSQQGGGGSFTLPVTTTHNHRVLGNLEWRNVANARVWVDEIGGEHYAFWHSTLLPGHRFAHYRGLVNDEASTTSVGLTEGARVGPYVWLRKGSASYEYARSIENVERRNNVRLPVVQVLEID